MFQQKCQILVDFMSQNEELVGCVRINWISLVFCGLIEQTINSWVNNLQINHILINNSHVTAPFNQYGFSLLCLSFSSVNSLNFKQWDRDRKGFIYIYIYAWCECVVCEFYSRDSKSFMTAAESIKAPEDLQLLYLAVKLSEPRDVRRAFLELKQVLFVTCSPGLCQSRKLCFCRLSAASSLLSGRRINARKKLKGRK